MHAAQDFLEALTVVLCVAGATTLLFQRLRQPVVLGYIIAGLIIGPHVPIPLVADPGVVHALSELGVILLMFSLGLEFSLAKLARVGATASVTAIVQSSLMVWLGFVTGRAFGWTVVESVFAGAIIAISSTTIIAKAFDEQKVGGSLRQLVVGVLIVEDLIAILLMTTLTAVSSGAGLSAIALATTVGKLVGFLAVLLIVGLLIVPRLVRATVRLGRPETILVSSIGVCFAGALAAHEAGYSVALGAFLAGMLIAESGVEAEVERLVEPVRDVFAAIFFVSVGMLIDPALVAEHWLAIVVMTVVVVVGKVIGVSLGGFLTGNGVRTSIQAGMSLAQIGEFSFIIATLGITLEATRGFLYPVAVAVSAITTLTTPWLIRAAGPVASRVDRALPGSLQTFAVLYASWLERLRRAPREPSTGRRRRATDLKGHARAGAELILQALAKQAAGPERAAALHEVNDLLKGLGDPVPLAIAAHSPAVGRSLAELDLRGLTGATVLAIARPDGGVRMPSAGEILRAGDVLAIAGAADAIDAARALLETHLDAPPPTR